MSAVIWLCSHYLLLLCLPSFSNILSWMIIISRNLGGSGARLLTTNSLHKGQCCCITMTLKEFDPPWLDVWCLTFNQKSILCIYCNNLTKHYLQSFSCAVATCCCFAYLAFLIYRLERSLKKFGGSGVRLLTTISLYTGWCCWITMTLQEFDRPRLCIWWLTLNQKSIVCIRL